MTDFKNKTVLITGGASGIGKIMTKLSLQRGARVIVWDIDQSAMDTMANEFSNLGNVECMNVDISKEDEIKKTSAQIINNRGGVAFDWIADSILGIYKTMEGFTGRKSG